MKHQCNNCWEFVTYECEVCDDCAQDLAEQDFLATQHTDKFNAWCVEQMEMSDDI